MSDGGPESGHDASYAEFFEEQRRIERAAMDKDLQLAVRHFHQVMIAPDSEVKIEEFWKARHRLDIAVQVAIWGYDIHETNWHRIIDAANEYMQNNDT